MSTETIPTRSAPQTIMAGWVNLIRSILSGDIVPRSGAGVAAANRAALGSPSLQYTKTHIFVGDGGPGDIEFVYDYSGLVVLPQGWLWLSSGAIVCDETTYDAQHSLGDWDAYGMSSSPLSGKNLPSFNGRYAVGTTSATQGGGSTITGVGAHTQNLSHNHGGSIVTSNDSAQAFADSNNADTDVRMFTRTHTHTITVPSALSAAANIEPAHFICKVMMRII